MNDDTKLTQNYLKGMGMAQKKSDYGFLFLVYTETDEELSTEN